VTVAFITKHRGEFGVESMCKQLPIAPSTYFEHQTRARDPQRLSVRAQRDAVLLEKIRRARVDSKERYGVRKVWRELKRAGVQVARYTVERLMRQLGIRGVGRGGHKVFTTIPDELPERPVGLVNRDFSASRPNALWVSDVTFAKTMGGFTYVAFVIDAFSKRIVGWRVTRSLKTSLVLDALEQALEARNHAERLVFHSDRSSQFLSIRYTQRLAEAGVAASVGSRGDAYDNALAEAINGLYKAEAVLHRGPWAHPLDVEIATQDWVHWFDHLRLYEAVDVIVQIWSGSRLTQAN